jgi:hypothetical protein
MVGSAFCGGRRSLSSLRTIRESIELTADDLRDVDKAASRITVEGARHPEHLERMTGPEGG